MLWPKNSRIHEPLQLFSGNFLDRTSFVSTFLGRKKRASVATARYGYKTKTKNLRQFDGKQIFRFSGILVYLRSLPARSLAILTRDSLEEACRKITRIVNILR